MQSPLKILFIDDHEGMRDSLSFLLEHRNPGLKIYAAGNVRKAVMYLKSNPDISMAIVDLNLNGENGLDGIPEYRTINPDIKIIVYTMFNDPIHIEDSLKADVQGYITKDMGVEDIEKAINSVSEGNIYYSADAQKIMYGMFHKSSMTSSDENGSQTANSVSNQDKTMQLFSNYKALTKKEQEVFVLLAEKKDIYEVAETLNKSVKTVQNQKSLIYQKLNIKDRLELLETARALGVII